MLKRFSCLSKTHPQSLFLPSVTMPVNCQWKWTFTRSSPVIMVAEATLKLCYNQPSLSLSSQFKRAWFKKGFKCCCSIYLISDQYNHRMYQPYRAFCGVNERQWRLSYSKSMRVIHVLNAKLYKLLFLHFLKVTKQLQGHNHYPVDWRRADKIQSNLIWATETHISAYV